MDIEEDFNVLKICCFKKKNRKENKVDMPFVFAEHPRNDVSKNIDNLTELRWERNSQKRKWFGITYARYLGTAK